MYRGVEMRKSITIIFEDCNISVQRIEAALALFSYPKTVVAETDYS